MITFRKAAADDVRPALDLAFKVFLEFEAPEYEPEAATRFKADIVDNQAAIQNWISGKNSMYVACDGVRIVGVAGEKWGNGHINIVFVDGEYHRKGIATELMNRIVCDLKLRGFNKLTLFSSPYGQPFYLKYGFTQTGPEQRSDGFIIIPMEYTPNEIWDVLDENGSKTGRIIERGRQSCTKTSTRPEAPAWQTSGYFPTTAPSRISFCSPAKPATRGGRTPIKSAR